MKYKNKVVPSGETRFTDAPMSETETSRFKSLSHNLTTMNAGDIVPVYCAEVLPRDTFSQVVNFAIRQSTLLKPTMGNMELDLYAFFVPNRIINESWENVLGKNSSGAWVQKTPVTLAPLVSDAHDTIGPHSTIQVPVGSVADYYGFPTQQPIPVTLLQQCNDLKFRGYLEIYNTFFRDQNFQPPVPYSKLNVYNGFFEPSGTFVSLSGALGSAAGTPIRPEKKSDGSYGAGSAVKALYGEGSPDFDQIGSVPTRKTSFSALEPPLKANKKHDYFTSCLPSPQKGGSVTFNLSADNLRVPLAAESSMYLIPGAEVNGVRFGGYSADGSKVATKTGFLRAEGSNKGIVIFGEPTVGNISNQGPLGATNLVGQADLSAVSAFDLASLRDGAALQQVYECLARGGSRYREFINSFFGLDVDDTLKDIPTYLGHISRDLDLYQTAQTSASESGSTPQGNLTGFGYTDSSAQLFSPFTFPEHGYVHVLAVVRQRNIYPAYFSPDNFRLGMTDFYLPQLANISEQPVRTALINPFLKDSSKIFGYQEAWAEYRYEPNRVSGYMRPGISESLSAWNYADEFDSGLQILNDSFLKSNAQAVLDRTLAVTSSVAPQFICDFAFSTEKQRPMPIYSIPGLDII